MQDYIIMTDSCCDLTDQMARELELEVLPLTMTMDGEEYPNTLDGRYITNEEFYKRLRAGKTSTTAAANVGQFEDAMRTVLGRGQDILCLCFSSALSTTYQSAVIAAENVAPDFPERTIRVIDTLSASRGQGLLVYLAAQKKKEGLTLSQLGDWVEDNKLHVCHWFTVDDLNFLKRGGRVSARGGFGWRKTRSRSAPVSRCITSTPSRVAAGTPPPRRWWAPCSPSSR